MKKQLTKIAPLRAGIVLGTLYAFLGLLLMPIFLLFTLLASHTGRVPAGSGGGMPVVFGGVLMTVLIPVFYGIMGFIGGIISAFLYNLIAGWTGGLEFEVRDVPPTV